MTTSHACLDLIEQYQTEITKLSLDRERTRTPQLRDALADWRLELDVDLHQIRQQTIDGRRWMPYFPVSVELLIPIGLDQPEQGDLVSVYVIYNVEDRWAMEPEPVLGIVREVRYETQRDGKYRIVRTYADVGLYGPFTGPPTAPFFDPTHDICPRNSFITKNHSAAASPTRTGW